MIAGTGGLIFVDALDGIPALGRVFEVPLMSAMFLAMVWHARRRQDALRTAELRAEQNSELMARREQFVNYASHELPDAGDAPARGHLDLALRANGDAPQEIVIAVDELERMDKIIERLLLLAKADLPDFGVREELDLEPFLEDVFIRWSEVGPRVWRLGDIPTRAR